MIRSTISTATQEATDESRLVMRKLGGETRLTQLDVIDRELGRVGRERLFGVDPSWKVASPYVAPLSPAEKQAAEIAAAARTPEGQALIKSAMEIGTDLGSQLYATDRAAALELVKASAIAPMMDARTPGSLNAFIKSAGMASEAAELFKDVNFKRVGIGAGVGAATGLLTATDPDDTARNVLMGAALGGGAAHAYSHPAVQKLLHGAEEAATNAHAPARVETPSAAVTPSIAENLAVADRGGDLKNPPGRIRKLVDKGHKVKGRTGEGKWLMLDPHGTEHVAMDDELAEKLASIMKEARKGGPIAVALGTAIPAAMQLASGSRDLGDIIAPAIGGGIAARQAGMTGVMEGAGSNLLLSHMKSDPGSVLSKGLANIDDPELRNIAYRATQVGLPTAGSFAGEKIRNLDL